MSKIKRPSFQFYSGDWLTDPALRSVSSNARGIWIDMLSLMHKGERTGYLQVNGKPPTEEQIARMCNATPEEVRHGLAELRDASVFSESADHVIFSRRMVRDERARITRAKAGSLGGNPAFVKGSSNPYYKSKDNQGDNHKDNQGDNQKITPSSSSSSSSSSSPSGKTEELERERNAGGHGGRWPAEWIVTAERIRKLHPRISQPVATDRAILEAIQREVDKGGDFAATAALLESQTVLYAEKVARWPLEDGRYVKASAGWYESGCYLENPDSWELQTRGKAAQPKREWRPGV